MLKPTRSQVGRAVVWMPGSKSRHVCSRRGVSKDLLQTEVADEDMQLEARTSSASSTFLQSSSSAGLSWWRQLCPSCTGSACVGTAGRRNFVKFVHPVYEFMTVQACRLRRLRLRLRYKR